MLSLVPIATAQQLEEDAKRRSEAKQNSPVIQGLAAHVQKRWTTLENAKSGLEERMLKCVRQRRMEYDPDKLQDIRAYGGSEIYMGITSVKCRGATSWLRDSMLGTGSDKPWRLDATPEPDLPPQVVEQVRAELMQAVYAQTMQTGQMPSPEEIRQVAMEMRDQYMNALKEEAELRMERMERKMEDQLIEGGFIRALHQALDDLVTFPFACIKGPVPRRRKVMQWVNGGLVTQEVIRLEWERVDPFRIYWANWADDPNDGPIIEKHKLTRADLEALIGVDGYNEDAIRSVLMDFGGGGLTSGEGVESDKAHAEGKDLSHDDGDDDLVDAIQLWDTIQGKLLIEWGMDPAEITDPVLAYPCEVWKVKNTVIRAVLNYDPLGRKPYYFTSYEKTPGSVDGNGVADLCRDSQDMCNAAARSLANNMGLASGPMVGINVDRLPAGEDITQMFPWKMFQFKSPDYADSTAPISFFQPSSNAAELMAVFERFASRADEDTGIPRYMTGEHVPGAGRTSSGLSMLISNAGKGIKQVVSNIDQDWIVPVLERLYQHNQRYSADPELVGDVHVVPKGAMSLVVKEAEATRRNEFLQLVLQSPLAQQIVGMGGAAELLRDAAKNLNGNVDRIVPDRKYIGQLEQAMATIQQLQALMAQLPEQINFQRDESGAVTGASKVSKNLQADGSEQGGRASNYISSRVTG